MTRKKHNYDLSTQTYKGIRLTMCNYCEEYYAARNAKRFILGDPKTQYQKIWIPNSCLLPNGTLKPGVDLDWLFRKPMNQKKLHYAHETNTELYLLPYK